MSGIDQRIASSRLCETRGSAVSRRASRAYTAYLVSLKDNGPKHSMTLKLSAAHDAARANEDYEVMSVRG